jgi:protein SCO1/2
MFAKALRRIGQAAKDVQVVYVTVDPQRDTPARLKEFLGYFNPSFVGGTGTEEQLQHVRSDFGVSARKIPYGNTYGYDHSSFTYLIDRKGLIRALMPYGHGPDDFAGDLSLLLGE